MEELKWRKSSYTGANGGDCVEMAKMPDAIATRDSKSPEDGYLTLPTAQAKALFRAIKAGRMDL